VSLQLLFRSPIWVSPIAVSESLLSLSNCCFRVPSESLRLLFQSPFVYLRLLFQSPFCVSAIVFSESLLSLSSYYFRVPSVSLQLLFQSPFCASPIIVSVSLSWLPIYCFGVHDRQNKRRIKSALCSCWKYLLVLQFF
jgi:hypothetical protein